MNYQPLWIEERALVTVCNRNNMNLTSKKNISGSNQTTNKNQILKGRIDHDDKMSKHKPEQHEIENN